MAQVHQTSNCMGLYLQNAHSKENPYMQDGIDDSTYLKLQCRQQAGGIAYTYRCELNNANVKYSHKFAG